MLCEFRRLSSVFEIVDLSEKVLTLLVTGCVSDVTFTFELSQAIFTTKDDEVQHSKEITLLHNDFDFLFTFGEEGEKSLFFYLFCRSCLA